MFTSVVIIPPFTVSQQLTCYMLASVSSTQRASLPRPAPLIRSNAVKIGKAVRLPHRQRVVKHESCCLAPTHHRGNLIFYRVSVSPPGPPIPRPAAAHGRPPGLQLTFPATRPSRTMPSLKSDIRRTVQWWQTEAVEIQPLGVQLSGAAPLAPVK